MKKLNKAIVAFGVSAAMLATGFIGATSANAAPVTGPFTITVNGNEKNHSISAYQIFKGDLDVTGTGAEEKTTLSNIQWGAGISADGQNALYTKYNLSGDDQKAANVAKAISDANMDATTAQALAKEIGKYLAAASGSGTATISVNDPGYYLLKDMASLDAQDDANSAFMMEVVKDTSVTMKTTKPTVDKKVQDETDDKATGANDEGWGASADHAIGESFDFKVTGTLPADADRAYYDTYQVKFTDTMSTGVTFEKIKTLTVAGAMITLPATGITVTEPTGDSNQLIIDIANVKKHLPEGTVITDQIEIVVTYTAHLNEDAKVNKKGDLVTTNQNAVYLEYSNNPMASGLGKTSTINTYVFTWEVPMLKVDSADNNKTLADAEFELTEGGAKIAFVAQLGGSYRRATAAEIADNAVATTTTIKSNAQGKFDVKGLDAGTYTLKETKAPSGYNLGGPWTVVIEAEHGTTATANSLTIKLDGTATDTVTIENVKGSQLPSTGGMGTVALYTAGAAIVLFAGLGLTLAMKRRNA